MSDIKISLADKEQYQVSFGDLDKRLFPRVTSIISEHMDKSAPLKWWAANTTISYLRHVFEGCDTMEQLRPLIFDESVWSNAQKRFTEVAREEADKGTRVHRVVESIFRSELDGTEFQMQIEKDIEKPVGAFLSWKEAHDVHPILLEEPVYALLPGQDDIPEEERIGYAGRLDCVLHVDGLVKTLDVKTGKAVYEDQKIQAGAYDFAFRYTFRDLGWGTNGAAILRLDKETGEPDYHEYNEEVTSSFFKVFYFLCMSYHSMRASRDRQKAVKKALKAAEKAEKAKVKEEDPY